MTSAIFSLNVSWVTLGWNHFSPDNSVDLYLYLQYFGLRISNILEESINPCLLLLFQGGNWWQDVFLERKAKVPEKERKYRICGHFSGENKEYMSAVGTFSAKPIHLLHYCLRGDSLDQVASQQIAINDFLHPPPYITIVNIHKEILNIGKQYNYQYWPKRSIVLTEIYPKNVKTICSGHKTFTTI